MLRKEPEFNNPFFSLFFFKELCKWHVRFGDEKTSA